jgi:hypothetical protein
LFPFTLRFEKFLRPHFNRRNTVYFKVLAHFVLLVEQFGAGSGAVNVQQVALWWVCFGIMWLLA